MPKYVMWGSYCDRVFQKREPFRQAHLAGIKQQKQAGLIVTIGSTADLSKVFAIYDAPDEETVRRAIESDPYWQHGIWTEYEVKEWIQAF
ncbi:hypothetical protein JJD41_13250 [Oxynema sp. CENA135]|uniref:YciI family protein n=1 Tax=Oxynema sp. CENA135 TaxID=984206 RepID=UPI00190C8812|nr:YciI family protein [Oxynema sp. CENA135]MBK4730820.1 hypothetical protein [Oxynema sp. CENA135]